MVQTPPWYSPPITGIPVYESKLIDPWVYVRSFGQLFMGTMALRYLKHKTNPSNTMFETSIGIVWL